jgi:hypothetical protein
MNKNWTNFLRFESKNNLFDITDSDGIHVWDTIRYYVYVNIFGSPVDTVSEKMTFNKLKKLIKRFFLEIKIIFLFFGKQKKVLFFLSSRNKFNTHYIDQNAYHALSFFEPKDRLIIESFNIGKDTEYYDEMFLHPCYSYFLKLFYKRRDFNFEWILQKIVEEFTNSQESISIHSLSKEYEYFYFSKNIYSFLLKKRGIKKIFMTQNGIQKGIFYAANNLKIPVYEFQHGSIEYGHPSYSYPENYQLADKTYLPDKIVALSDFWFKDVFLPTSVIPIGNDFFYPQGYESIEFSKKNILIISANIVGKQLSEMISDLATKKSFSDFNILFKLHPNQLSELQDFQFYFKNYTNVTVYGNEISVPDLLKKCETTFSTYISTASYEAIQCNRKVLIWSDSFNKERSHFANCTNFYVVNNIDQLNEVMSVPIDKNDKHTFFAPFNRELFEKEFIQ